MPKQEFLSHITLLTQQFDTLQDLIKSSYAPHCDNCGRSMNNEGWIIMGIKKVCGICMDHK